MCIGGSDIEVFRRIMPKGDIASFRKQLLELSEKLAFFFGVPCSDRLIFHFCSLDCVTRRSMSKAKPEEIA